MNGYPVTVRLLDPPLHEFVPHDEKGQKEMAEEMNVPLQKIVAKVESLAEFNPMLVTAAAVWATPIRRSPRCRPVPSSRPQ